MPDLDDPEAQDAELLKIDELVGKNGVVETRMIVPSQVKNYSTDAIISLDRPTINKEYSLNSLISDADLNKDFFFVDKNLISKYETDTKTTFTLGDTLPVSFDYSLISGFADSVFDNWDEYIDKLVEQLKTNDNLAEIVKILDNQQNRDYLKSYLKAKIDESFSTPLNIKVNGIMSHPENIQNSTFNPSYFMLGTRTLLSSIVDKVNSAIDMNEIISDVELQPDYEGKQDLVNILKKYQPVISLFQLSEVSKVKDQIMDTNDEETVKSAKRIYNQYIIKVDEKYTIEEIYNDILNYFDTPVTDSNKHSLLMDISDKSSYPSNSVIQNDIVQSRQLTYCFPIIFFVVAVLVVLTTLSQMMLKQRTQIGTMKALGITRKQILIYYLSFVNIIGIVGLLVGVIVGPILLPQIMNIKYSILYELPKLGYTFPWFAFLLMFVLVVGSLSLITYLIIRKELSYQPAASMRPATPKIKFKENKHETKNTSLMIALRNIRVHITKSFMVIIGVMGCTGLLICGMGIDDSIDYGKNIDVQGLLSSDFTATYNSNIEKGKVEEEVLKITGVESCNEYNLSVLAVKNEETEKKNKMNFFYFPRETKSFSYDDSLDNGHWDLNCVALTEAKANDINAHVGDTVSFTINNTIYKKKVDYIFYSFSSNAIFIYEETIPDLFTTRNGCWVNSKKDDKGDPIMTVNYLKNNILDVSGIDSCYSYQDNQDRIESYMTSVHTMTGTIKVFAILLAIVVLVNLAILNFQERLRDIATLRVLGFSKFEIARSLVYEVMILTFIGALIGLLLGVPLEILVLSTNVTPLVSWHYVIYWYTFLLAFVISFITALLVNIAISYKIDHIDMAESLKSIE